MWRHTCRGCHPLAGIRCVAAASRQQQRCESNLQRIPATQHNYARASSGDGCGCCKSQGLKEGNRRHPRGRRHHQHHGVATTQRMKLRRHRKGPKEPLPPLHVCDTGITHLAEGGGREAVAAAVRASSASQRVADGHEGQKQCVICSESAACTVYARVDICTRECVHIANALSYGAPGCRSIGKVPVGRRVVERE